jgi:uncharacterized glyoxalase superfamily protein PhnB
MTVKYKPEGFHSVTPFFIVKGTERFINFLKDAFDAEEISVSKMPDGSIMYAQLKIGDSFIMMGEESENYKPTQSSVYLYIQNVDEVFKKALKAGASSLREPQNEFYGDRTGGVADQFGNQWWISTHIEDVSESELKKREEDFMKQRKSNN